MNGIQTPPSAKRNYQQAVHAEDPETAFNIDLAFLPRSKLPPTHQPLLTARSRLLLRWLEQTGTSELPLPDPWQPPRSWDDFVVQYQSRMADRRKAIRSLPPRRPSRKEAEIKRERDQLRSDFRLFRVMFREFKDRWREFREEKAAFDAEYAGLSFEQKRDQLKQRRQMTARWKEMRAINCELEAERAKVLEESRARRKHLQAELNRIKGKEPQDQVSDEKVAILVSIDNCSREVAEIRVFESGTSVTSHEVAEAMEEIFPDTTDVVITDNGSQFTGKEFTGLLAELLVIHLLIWPRRPCTNGTVERFNRTIKEWLKEKYWRDEFELRSLISQFLIHYNSERPHQALGGLTPVEYKELKWMNYEQPDLKLLKSLNQQGCGPSLAKVSV